MPPTRRSIPFLLVLLAAGLLPSPAGAQPLRDRLRDFEAEEFWIYDDWNAARELAAKLKKPIFAVFRCVP